MNCPICDTAMDEGEVYLKKSFFNFLAFGFGSTNLIFKRDKPKQEMELMNPWDFNKAFHCSKCGATLIATETGRG